MGEVYLVQHPRLPRRDALKVLPAEFTTDDEYRDRFNREAEVAATLWHPHIVGVHDRGEFEGRLWIAMDYVEGTDVPDLLHEQLPAGLPPDDVVRIITAVADALDYAHQHQLSAPRRQARQHPAAEPGLGRRASPAGGLRHRPADRRLQRADAAPT